MPERREQVDEIVWSALQREPQDREAFLKEACAGDAALFEEAASLVAADAQVQAEDFLREPLLGDLQQEKQHESLVGQQIKHYEVTRKIDTGGSGQVFLAQDKKLGRQVALKFLLTELTISKEHLRRFKREAQATSALNHPNILTVYEIGEIDSQYFIAAEYVEGETLRERLSRAHLEIDEAIRIAIQVADALSAAHKEKIIHRDIKPENIMIRSDGYVKVLDFGIAKMTVEMTRRHMVMAKDLPGADTLSSTHGIMGTIRYMSPEQACGQDVDTRTDIWSLGVVLYEMTARRLPFEGETLSDIIKAICENKPPTLRDVREGIPHEFQRIVSKALAKNKRGRYKSVGELRDDLERLRLKRSQRRRNRILVASALVATIIVSTFGLVGKVWYTERSREALTHDLIAQALAIRKDRPDLLQTSTLLTLEAYKRKPSSEIYQAIYEGLSILPQMNFQVKDDEFIYSADGRYFITGGEDGAVRFWDVNTKKEVNRYQFQAPILKLTTTSDGKYLALKLRDKSKKAGEDIVIIVDAASSEKVSQLQKPCSVGEMVFSPDRQLLTTTDSCGDYSAVRLWTVPDGVQTFEFVHQRGIPRKAVFSPDSRYIATEAEFPEQKIETHIWETQTGREIRLPDQDEVGDVEFSPDGKYVAAASKGHIIELFDAASFKSVGKIDQKESMNTMTFSPDGKYLATSNEPDDLRKENGSSTLLVYEVPTGRQIGRFNNEDHSHFAVFSRDSKHIASCSYSPVLRDRKDMTRVWDLNTGSEISRVTGDNFSRAIFSPDNKYIITDGDDVINNPFTKAQTVDEQSDELKTRFVGMIRGWDPFSRPLETRRFMTKPSTWRHYTVSSNGRYFAASVEDENVIQTWDLNAGNEISRINYEGKNLTLTISDNGKFIAADNQRALGGGTMVEVWNTETREKVLSRPQREWIPHLELSYDGFYLAELDQGNVRLVNVKAGKESAVLRHHDAVIRSMDFSPASASIITGSDRNLQIWDIVTGQSLSNINNTGDISFLRYSSDGQYVAAVKSMSGLVTVYKVSGGQKVMSVQHDTNNVFGAQFSLDGKYLATYEAPFSGDDRLHIFEVATEQEVARIRKDGGAFFSEDGLLVTFDGASFTWKKWQPRDILSEACARLTTNLTEREWQRFLPGETYRKTCENLP